MKNAREAETPNTSGRLMGAREIRRRLGSATSAGRPVKASGTGTPSHFQQWKLDADVKKHLRKMTVSWLAEQVQKSDKSKAGAAVSTPLFKLATVYANVWDLSQARWADLIAVPGVGDRGLKHLQKYLEGHEVKLRWNDGD